MAYNPYNVYAPDPLNEQASVLVDVQTYIKITIKNGVLNGAPFSIIQNKVREIINRALSKIKSQTLKEDARKSLMDFSNKIYARLKLAFPNPIIAVAIWQAVKAVSLSINEGKTLPTAETYIPQTTAEKTAFQRLYGETYETTAKGIPLQEFQKTYMERVKTVFHELAQEKALDPSDQTGRNTLRNLAEMQVRYERHQEELAKLRADGVKLVVCSAHADCSVRCSPYQGRVYSLDGTYGTTEDGRDYEPIENATQNPRDRYVTNAGRVYQNGLLGFNCRHKLFPYKVGMVVPFVDEETQKRERAITRRQRQLEITVVNWRNEALMQKGNAVEYFKARKKAIYWNKRYIEYSKNHGRAYYPDRVKIL